MLKTHDKLDRAFPNQLVLIDDAFTITDTDVYGTFEPINLHGPLFTSYLLDFAAFYRDTPRYTKDRLGWLARSTNIRYESEIAGPVILRPKQQFPGPFERPSRNMMLLHALSPRGAVVLKKAGRYHPIKHGGWFEHQVANGCISASLHLAALHAEQTFIPPDRIAEDTGVTVPYTIKDKKSGTSKDFENHRLVPDYLFGVDRFYAVETDLGNEVGRADIDLTHRRKTYERMVLQYLELIGRSQDDAGTKLYNTAYRIPRNKALLVLFVTTERSKLDLMESIIKQHAPGGACNFILMKHVPAEAFSAFHSPKPLYTLWTEPWKRAGRGDFYINNPARQ
jgi:hypothetical protein